MYMVEETIESLTAQLKELRELMDRRHDEAMREINALKAKLGQKPSAAGAKKEGQQAGKSEHRRRRSHANETSILVLAEARSQEDKDKLIKSLMEADFARLRPRQMRLGDVLVRCKKDDKQAIVKKIQALGWEVSTKPEIIINMQGYPEGAAEKLSKTIGEKGIEGLTVKVGRNSGDVLIRCEEAKLEEVKALVEKIKLDGKSVNYTIEE